MTSPSQAADLPAQPQLPELCARVHASGRDAEVRVLQEQPARYEHRALASGETPAAPWSLLPCEEAGRMLLAWRLLGPAERERLDAHGASSALGALRTLAGLMGRL